MFRKAQFEIFFSTIAIPANDLELGATYLPITPFPVLRHLQSQSEHSLQQPAVLRQINTTQHHNLIVLQ